MEEVGTINSQASPPATSGFFGSAVRDSADAAAQPPTSAPTLGPGFKTEPDGTVVGPESRTIGKMGADGTVLQKGSGAGATVPMPVLGPTLSGPLRPGEAMSGKGEMGAKGPMGDGVFEEPPVGAAPSMLSGDKPPMGLLMTSPSQLPPGIHEVVLDGCQAGVGLGLNSNNQVTILKPLGRAAARAAGYRRPGSAAH